MPARDLEIGEGMGCVGVFQRVGRWVTAWLNVWQSVKR